MSHFPEHIAGRYRRFKSGRLMAIRDRYAQLAEHGQNPDVMIVSCCDSRVEPEAIFDAGPGDLFVLRNVANLVPPHETGGKFHGVSAALEFAVLNLHVRHIIVMGHSACGGVKAALDHDAAQQTDARFISNWMSVLDEAKRRVLAAHQGASTAQLITALEHEGVRTSLANLRTFPFIAEAEERGRLTLHGAYFDIKDGALSVLNSATGEYDAL